VLITFPASWFFILGIGSLDGFMGISSLRCYAFSIYQTFALALNAEKKGAYVSPLFFCI
jgi:hypothetical protein